MKFSKKQRKLFFKLIVLCFVMATTVSGLRYFVASTLPDEFTFENIGNPVFGNQLYTIDTDTRQGVSAVGNQGDDRFVMLRIMGLPIKRVKISQSSAKQVYLGGNVIGIRLKTDGAMVVELGSDASPAKKAGIQVGDLILQANGQKISGNEDLQQIAAMGKSVAFLVQRGGNTQTVQITPEKQGNECYFGMWVRDSSAGIGTLTCVTEDGTFVGLGHGISDAGAHKILTVQAGEIFPAYISDISRGKTGTPGMLHGSFLSYDAIGKIEKNEESGVSGDWTGSTEQMEQIEIAPSTSVTTGKAQIICCIDADKIEYYDITIKKVNYSQSQQTKNIVISVTDRDLLKKTGGIVQGMSGSPIIQNGKLVGAVTHVLVNDPTRGYGIFIENMLEAAG